MAETGFITPTAPRAYQWLAVNISSSGDNTIVTGVANQKIKVYKLILSAASSLALSIKDGSTVVHGPSTGTSWSIDADEAPITLQPGNNLVINLGSAVQVGGSICYFQE